MSELDYILKRSEKAKALRDLMSSQWREISDYVRPVKQNIGDSAFIQDHPSLSRLASLFDSSAILANQTYAAGCMSWMTPSESTWFAFDAPEYLSAEDSVKSWYSRCTDVANKELARSNFYSQIHECYLDDGAFGTSGTIIDDDDGTLNFEAMQIGDYSVLENHRRQIDSVFRQLRLTPRQAVEKFGASNVHKNTRELLEKNDPVCDVEQEYLHIIMPRAVRDPEKIDTENMPWRVMFVDMKNKHVCRDGGAWEQPFAVHRHLLWSRSPYGYGPGMQVLADMRQLNWMQQCLDTQVEKYINPPLLVPSSFEGRVDMRAGGVTYYPMGDGNKPAYWENQANYMIGEDRVLFRGRQINGAFHVELFQALSAVPPGKEMTAAEIHMRQRDRLTLFSPTFARKNQELNTPIMKRVFAILLREGAFPPPPPKLVQIAEQLGGYVPDPEIVYTSRLALQIRAIQNDTITRVMSVVSPMATLDPSLLDNFDLDAAVRLIARNEGLHEDVMRSEQDISSMRQNRAEAQAQMDQQAAMMDEVEGVSKLASAGVAVA